MSELCDAIYGFLSSLDVGGDIDLCQSAVGAYCAEIDIQASNFQKYMDESSPQPIRKFLLDRPLRRHTDWPLYYGYKGLDGDVIKNGRPVTEKYGDSRRNLPLKKLINIWNAGTGDGKIQPTYFYTKALRRLTAIDRKADDRFMYVIEKKADAQNVNNSSTVKSSPISKVDIDQMIANYENNRKDYMTGAELNKVERYITNRE